MTTFRSQEYSYEGIRVPAGFCVTTAAFQRIMAGAPSIDGRLARLAPGDRAAIRALSAELETPLTASQKGH